MDRRDFLATSLALAASVLFPFEVKGAGHSPEELELQAQTLAGHAEGMGPALALRTSRKHLRTIDSALAAAQREYQRRPLHRAASTTAVVCARASRWCGLDGHGWLTLAETHASAADDGPRLAQAWLERGNVAGEAEHCADCSSPAALQHYVAALDRAGTGHEQSGARANARLQMAWELAAEGDQHRALLELDAATFEAQKAGWEQTVIDSRVGTILRKLGRLVDAELALSGALDTPPVRRVWVLCDLARTYLASRDADTAAEVLEEAFLLTRAHGIEARLPRIVSARSLLPPGRAARELDEVMRGA